MQAKKNKKSIKFQSLNFKITTTLKINKSNNYKSKNSKLTINSFNFCPIPFATLRACGRFFNFYL